MDDEKEESSYGETGGECAACLKDMKEAWDAGDFDTAAAAFKQAVHAANEGGADDGDAAPEGDEPKGGLLAILGKPKKS